MSTPPEEPIDPITVIRGRVKELRGRKGWSATELGRRLAEVGIPWNRSVVANFESGRRPTVSLQEIIALALILDVAPVHLLVPLDNRPYQLTPSRTENADDVRSWLRGEQPLAGVDERTFRAEVSMRDMYEEIHRREPFDEKVREIAQRRGMPVSAVLREIAERLDKPDDGEVRP